MKDGITEEYLKTLLEIIPKTRAGYGKKTYTKLGSALNKEEKKVYPLAKPGIRYTFTKVVELYTDHLPVLRRIAKDKGMKGLEEYVNKIKSLNINQKRK